MKKIKFKVEGQNPQNFINALYNRNINLYGVSIIENGLICSVELEKFKHIQNMYANSNYKIAIISQPKYNSYKTFLKCNIGILISLIIITVALGIYSGRVWQFKVYGLDNVEYTQIEKNLNAMGVKRGMLKTSIDLSSVANNLVKNVEGVALASVNMVGTTLVITINEKIDNSQLLDNEGAIVAQNSCVITKIITTAGTALVKVGDKVAQGQTLIANYVIDANGNRISSRARGEIWADVYYSYTKTFSSTNYSLKRSGKTQKVTFLENSSQSYACKYANYETETRTFYISNVLPLMVTEITFYELKQVEYSVDLEKEENKLIEITKNEAKTTHNIQNYDNEVVNVSALNDGKKQVTVTYIKQEKIINKT